MSIESAKSFIERINSDEAFTQKITACKDPEKRSAIVRELGFDFTASELREAGTVLSDDDLEGVAGGVARANPNVYKINLTIT